MDLADRLARLNASVGAVQARRAGAVESDRAAKWARIQRDAPEVAAVAREFRAVFPAAKLIKVLIQGERVV